MTERHEIEPSADEDFWILARARGELLSGMDRFLAFVETDAAARRAVIYAADTHSGIEAWRDFFNSGRDVCLAIEARIAAEEALR